MELVDLELWVSSRYRAASTFNIINATSSSDSLNFPDADIDSSTHDQSGGGFVDEFQSSLCGTAASISTPETEAGPTNEAAFSFAGAGDSG